MSAVEFDFTLTGRTGLLMSADDIGAADELRAWLAVSENKKLSTPGDDRTPPWGWMIRIHHDGDHMAIPSDVIMAMLREAGKKITLKGQTTFKGETQAALFIAEEHCKLEGGAGQVPMAALKKLRGMSFAKQAEEVQKLGFRLFMKRVAVERKKHVRVRPRFDAWTVTGRIEVTEPTITEEVLNTLFRLGGGKCGLLDWRPNAKSPGSCGQFDHTLVRIG